ncbi:MAG: Crp/Fnr family transcriptional regulator [Thiohalomonadales bacterium]
MLTGIPFFSGLDDSLLTELHAHGSKRTYPKNTIIINEGDSTDSLYFIESGKVKVYLSDENGKEIIVNNHKTGEYFGELALIDDSKRSASVMTTEKSVFKIVARVEFEKFLENHPKIALSLIKVLTQRIRNLTENVRSLALMDVYGRVAKTLISLSEIDGEKQVIKDKLTQQDIANRVGASREMVARILKDLTFGGYISNVDRRIVINEKLPEHY